MKLVIRDAENGWIVEHDGARTVVEEQEDPADSAASLLWLLIEILSFAGSRYDQKRVRVIIEPGDKHQDGGADAERRSLP